MATKNKGQGTCHTEQAKAPPSTPKQGNHNVDWPAPGYDYGLKQDKQSGKNRDRGSFKGGSVW